MEPTPKPTEAPKPKSRTMLLAVIIVAILVVVGVGVYFLTMTSTTPPPTGPLVTIKDDGACGSTDTNCLFTPASINATVNGNAVTWKNTGTVTHTVTTCDSTNGDSSTQCPNGIDATGLDSFNLNVAAGASVTHVFAKAGTYYYYCNIHPFTMHGTVIAS
jgi:plastocyanin